MRPTLLICFWERGERETENELEGTPCTQHATPGCGPLLTCLLPGSGSSGGHGVAFKFSASFWTESELHLFVPSAWPFIKKPVIVSSCQCTCSISCSFPLLLVPLHNKTVAQTKPNQALLRCVSVVSPFFTMCLACHCSAASHQWWLCYGLEMLGL